MKILRLDFRSLRNNEHFQCGKETRALIDEFEADKLKIVDIFKNEYVPAHQEEDEAILKIVKNSFTEARSEIDRKRDGYFAGMVYANKAALKHFESKVVSSAKRLKILFDTYGNIARLPLQEETSAIYNLIQELDGTYSQDVELVHLKDWKDKLEESNKEYENLLKQGYEEEAAKTELRVKAARTAVDAIFRRMVERLEALMVLEGEDAYKEFVRRLNLQLEKYDNLLAQREGRASAKKSEQVDEETSEGMSK